MSTTRSRGAHYHDVESVDDLEGTMRADYLGGAQIPRAVKQGEQSTNTKDHLPARQLWVSNWVVVPSMLA